MFENQFKAIDDALRKDAGCSSELDYIEQTSWVLFLKYLSNYESEKEAAAQLDGKPYTPILADEFSWQTWAMPKKPNGKPDHSAAMTGEDLKDFVEDQLFPYLRQFKERSDNPDTIHYKIGEIFGELNNKLQSGYSLREVINKIDEIHFHSTEHRHKMSALYEDKIRNMGNAGRNGGEYYTPRPLVKAIIKVIKPRIGDTIYDSSCGSAGFLCEAYAYLCQTKKQLTVTDYDQLQKNTFSGVEKKSLAYVIGTMNMILHGIEAPNIIHKNTLTENINHIQDSDRVDVVLTNPPFGGNEHEQIKSTFPIKTGETAYLFLQHIIKKLKAGGKAGVVIKNSFLSNTDNASISLRKELLDRCYLYAVLDFPQTPFIGTGVKTVVLFFEKGRPSKDIWYYQMDPALKFGKTNPLTEKHLRDFIALEKTKADSDNSWTVHVKNIDKETCDLTVRNPHRTDEADTRAPAEILSHIDKLNKDAQKSIEAIESLLGKTEHE